MDDGFWDCNTIIKCVVGVENRELAYKISLQLSVDGGPSCIYFGLLAFEELVVTLFMPILLTDRRILHMKLR